MRRHYWSALVLGLVSFVCAPASARHFCPNWTSCFFENGPLISQNQEGLHEWFPSGDPNLSALCVPTASTMAIRAAESESFLGARPGSWIAQRMAPRYLTASERVTNEAILEGTDPIHGTSWDALVTGVAARGKDFFLGNGYAGPWWQTLGTWDIANGVSQAKVAQVVGHGWYRSMPVSRFGAVYIQFFRDGGHALDVNGEVAIQNSNGSFTPSIFVYNPWYAMREWYQMNVVVSGWYQVNNVPVFFQAPGNAPATTQVVNTAEYYEYGWANWLRLGSQNRFMDGGYAWIYGD